MLHSSVGKTILDGLFGLLGRTSITFIGYIYLGLLTRLPNDNGAEHGDGTYFSEPDDETYFRIRIDDISRITETPFITHAEAGDAITVGEDTVIPAYVTNQSIIMFPESSVDWDTIVGFGLFRSQTGTSLPFLWGSVSSADGEDGVTIKQHEVPIIREGGFKVSLM